MGFLKALFNAIFGPPPILDLFERADTAMEALRLLRELPAHEAVSMLAEGLAKDPRSSVRKMCIIALTGHEIDDHIIMQIINALRDRSAVVRQAAASFIGVRGSQRRAILTALRPLLEAI